MEIGYRDVAAVEGCAVDVDAVGAVEATEAAVGGGEV